MENIIDDLRECIEQFLQFDDDETLAIFRDAILNNDNQELNETFDSFPNLVNGNYKFYRILIILIMTSDYYEYCKYDKVCNKYIKFLDRPDLKFQDIISSFVKNKNFAFELMKSNFYYARKMDTLLTTACVENILSYKRLLKQMLKINFYSILDYAKKYNFDDFEDEDVIKFFLHDIYAQIEKQMDNYDLDADENFNSLAQERFTINLTAYLNNKIDELFVSAFSSKLKEIYNNDIERVSDAIQFTIYYILSEAAKDSNNLKECKKIYLLIKELYEPSDIVIGFLYDSGFASTILEYYRKSILYKFSDTNPQYLLLPQVKTLRLLKRINPFDNEGNQYDTN